MVGWNEDLSSWRGALLGAGDFGWLMLGWKEDEQGAGGWRGDSERRRLERARTAGAGHGGEAWGQRGATDSVCLCAPRWGARLGVVGEGGMGAGLPGKGDPPDISVPGPVGP